MKFVEQIAILLGCVKEEMYKEYPKKVSGQNRDAKEENKVVQSTLSFWTVSVLDCVEFVLKPPKGGPPSLPEFTDAVTLFPFIPFIQIYKLYFFFRGGTKLV